MNNILSFKVNRPNGKENLTAFRFSVKNVSGSVYDWSNTTYLPGEFETYEYRVDLTGKITNPQTISLIPVYGTKLGLEANTKIKSGTINVGVGPSLEQAYALQITSVAGVDFGINWSEDLVIEMEMMTQANSRSLFGKETFGPYSGYLNIDSLDFASTYIYGYLNGFVFEWTSDEDIFGEWHNYTIYSNGSNPLIDEIPLILYSNWSLDNIYTFENLTIESQSYGSSFKITSLKISSDKTGSRQLLNNFIAKPKRNVPSGGYYSPYPGCFQDIQNGNKEYCSNAGSDFSLYNATSGESISGNGGSY